MSLDGIVVKAIVDELKNTLIDGKIDKVYQPENDEILLNIRSKGSNHKLLISASSNNPRVYLTSNTKSNPTKPPMFCMLLRKHLQGSRIVDVNQPDLERIINIKIQNYDELGILTNKILTIEIMGRHSNIILMEENSEKIIDSIKRVTPDISSVRQVMPGTLYELPPSQDKLNPLFISKDTLFEKMDSHNLGEPIFKFIYKAYMGISPLIAREICNSANVNNADKIGELSDEDKQNIYIAFSNLMEEIKYNKYKPTIVMDSEKTKILGFSVIDINQYNNTHKIHYDKVSSVLEGYYITRDSLDRIKQKSTSLRKIINTLLDRAKNKLVKQKEELIVAENREQYKVLGDLITANIYQMEKGQSEITVENFYSEELKSIKIKLDIRLTPSQNAQKYFKKYNKLKNAYDYVSKEIEKGEQEVDYLEHILVSMDNCSDVSELDEIRDELIKEGYIRGNAKDSKNKNNQKKSNPHHYISSDGYDIYVGKNNQQNDYLTLKLAGKEDIWLHTKDIPGSHVIIKVKDDELPEATIKEAALLAAFYSKGNMSSNVPVDYTERKNVKKPSGAKLGMVIYENNNTVYVTPKLEEINAIKKIEE